MCVSSGEVVAGPSSPHNECVPMVSQNPAAGPFIYRHEIGAFILDKSELQVWSKMCVSSGEVFSGPSSPHKGRVVSLDSQNPVGRAFDMDKKLAFVLYRSELQAWSKMCVSSGEVFSGPSSTHKGRVVSLDSQSPVG